PAYFREKRMPGSLHVDSGDHFGSGGQPLRRTVGDERLVTQVFIHVPYRAAAALGGSRNETRSEGAEPDRRQPSFREQPIGRGDGVLVTLQDERAAQIAAETQTVDRTFQSIQPDRWGVAALTNQILGQLGQFRCARFLPFGERPSDVNVNVARLDRVNSHIRTSYRLRRLIE